MKRMIPNDKPVHCEIAKDYRLLRGRDPERFLAGLDARQKMGIGASAADARKKLGQSGNGFTLHGGRKKPFVLRNFEMRVLDFVFTDAYIKRRRSLNFSQTIQCQIKCVHGKSSKCKN